MPSAVRREVERKEPSLWEVGPLKNIVRLVPFAPNGIQSVPTSIKPKI